MANMNIRTIEIPCSISNFSSILTLKSTDQRNLNESTKTGTPEDEPSSLENQYSQQSAFDFQIKEAIELNRKKNEGFTYEISFSIHYKTTFGEKIVVTGSSDWLGNWDPSKAFDLEWSGENRWSNIIFLSEGSIGDLEYKYVCVSSNYSHWEQGKNRTLKVSEAQQFGQKLFVKKEDIWDK